MNNPFSDAIRGLGDNVSNALKGLNPLSQPSLTSLFGFTVPGTPLISTRDYFLSQMESWFTAIPLRTQWMVLIQQYPTLLTTQVIQQLENTVGNPNNFDINQAVSILKSYPLNKVIGCLFAQGVDIPQMEQLEVGRDKVFGDKQRGFIPGLISNGREPFQNLTIQFRETNTSFVDFVIRPWTILAENFGMVARPDGDERNPDCVGCGISGDEEEYSAGPNTDPGAAFTLQGYFRDEEGGGEEVPINLAPSIYFETGKFSYKKLR